jgi:hypothetical protein
LLLVFISVFIEINIINDSVESTLITIQFECVFNILGYIL